MKNDNVADNSIQMTEQWAEELADLPFVSKQRGRMSFLLKKKSKIDVERKDRVTYEAYDVSKRPRIVQESQTLSQSASQPQTQMFQNIAATQAQTQSQEPSYLNKMYKDKEKEKNKQGNRWYQSYKHNKL